MLAGTAITDEWRDVQTDTILVREVRTMFCALATECTSMISPVGTLWTDTDARAGLAMQTGIVFEVREADIVLNAMTLHVF